MGIAYITEFENLENVGGSIGQIAAQPPIAEQTVSYTTHTESSALNANTKYVRVHTDSICSVSFGTAPSATTSKMRMAANQTEYFKVPKNFSYKLSFVANT